jgi:hypothetical protein
VIRHPQRRLPPRWSVHNVRYDGAGVKHFHHHDVSDLELDSKAST